MSNDFDPVINDPLHYDNEYPATMKPVYFNSYGKKLIGSMFVAAGKGPHPTVLLLHGFPGNELNMDLAQAMRRAGFNTAIFHYRGSWGSEGDFSWQNCIDDTKVAIEMLRSDKAKEIYRIDAERIVLVGHSMGGFTAFMNLINDDKIDNAAYLSGFNFGMWGQLIKDNKDAQNLSLDKMEHSVQIVNGTTARKLLDEMIEHHEKYNLVNYAEKLAKKNLLMIGANYDQVAPIDFHHIPLVEAIKKHNMDLNTKVLMAGHSFEDKRIELTREVINWLNKIEW